MNRIEDGMVKGRDPIVIKLGSNGAKDRHVSRIPVKCFAVSLHLFANIPYGIIAAALFKFVDYHQIGKIQHVDFFKL